MVERAEEVTERIRSVALGLFNRVGYGNTNVEQIASEAGVGVASLYRRWPDKAALANDLLGRGLDRFEQIYAPIDATRPKERFLVLWTRFHAFVVDDPEIFLFLEDGAKATYISAENTARKAAMVDDVVDLLASAGVRADAEVANAMVLGTLVALVRAGVEPDVHDLGERFWQALRTDRR